MCDLENHREAAGLAVGVSNQLMAAALAMLAILGAVLVFILDKRETTWYGILIIGLSFFSFILCVGAGAKGVAQIYRLGNSGTWNYQNGDPWFQYQAGLALLGIVLFPIGVALMPTPRSEAELQGLLRSVDSLKSATVRLDSQVQHSRVMLDSFVQSARRSSGRPAQSPLPSAR